MANFAVIQTGGKQYLVKSGDVLRVEKLDVKEGAKLKFDILLLGDDAGQEVKVGQPLVKGAAVEAEVVKHGRHDKVTIIKFHAKARYKRKAGHRQPFTEIRIGEIKA